MELEERYLVIKKSRMLPHEQPEVLRAVACFTVDALVIEKDWPEYAPTLALLSARVDAEEKLNGYVAPLTRREDSMTTTVIIKAHCAKEKEVLIQVSTADNSEEIILQDGETWERCVYDDRSISVCEQVKAQAGEPQTFNAQAGAMESFSPD